MPSADENIRAELEQKAAQQGWAALHTELTKIDPISAARINPSDSQRINRALEVFYITGKSLTELTEEKGEALPYDFCAICNLRRKIVIFCMTASNNAFIK